MLLKYIPIYARRHVLNLNMFSSWWPRSSSSSASTKSVQEKNTSTSLLFPNLSQNHSTNSQKNTRKSKVKSKKEKKHKKSKQLDSDRFKKVQPVNFFSLSNRELSMSAAKNISILTGRHEPKESCNIINLEMSLPLHFDPHKLQLYKQEQVKPTSQVKLIEGAESRDHFREKSSVEQSKLEEQPRLSELHSGSYRIAGKYRGG